MRAGVTTFAATALACLAFAGAASADDPYVSQVADLNSTGSGVQATGLTPGTELDGKLLFEGLDDTHGWELFATDGTSTGLVKDINPTGTSGSFPGWFARVGGTLYFGASDGTHGAELWKSDGTPGGTVQVKDINTTTASASASPIWLTDVGGTLFFRANDGTGSELYTSDGTSDGTTKVADINAAAAGSSINYIFDVNGTAVFLANDGVHGMELWQSDGTGPGTRLIDDINPAGDSGWNGDGAILNGDLYFRADDGTGSELWKTDGATAERVTNINPDPTGGASPTRITRMGSALYFSADDGTGPELWRTDGTSTAKVKDIAPGPSGSAPAWMTAVGSTLYFRADDGSHGPELWRTDGTAGGTAIVHDINGGSSGSALSAPVGFGGSLYFFADDGTHGTELWRSDGTGAGTVMVKDARPGALGSGPTSPSQPLTPAVVGDSLFFQADDGTTGLELWRAQRLPTSTLDRSAIGFGSVETNAITAPQTVTVTNNGGKPLNLSALQLGGSDPGDFVIVSSTCGAQLAVGDSCSFGVRFAPSATGQRTATLTVIGDASNPGTSVVSLAGTGTTPSSPATTTITTTITEIIPGDPPARDSAAPRVTIGGLPATIKRAKLLKGVKFTVGSDEPAAITGDLLASARSAALGRIRASAFNLVLAHSALAQGSGRRTMRLKPNRRLIGRAKRFKLQVAVTATDAAGNRTTATKVLRVR